MATSEDSPYLPLLNEQIWKVGYGYERLTIPERVRLSYLRAQSIARHIDMTVEDIVNLSPKFWDFHSDSVTGADSAASTILAIHWNLCMGTIAQYGLNKPHIRLILDKLAKFEVCGDFMLTEVGHGLDARNIETTATLQDDGSFDLHTPHEGAAKSMPPTTPWAGIPRVAVVFARPVVRGEVRGLRPFLVHISDVDTMAPGVSCRVLPNRPGARVVDHAITTFNHVRVPPEGLLTGLEDLDVPDARDNLYRHIRRVPVGTLALSMTNIPTLRLSGYIAGRYSQKRRIATNKPGETMPVITFATQHGPVLAALAQASVLEAFARWTVRHFQESADDPRVQAALACVFKEIAIHYGQATMSELIDRCGWQGLYCHNQISELVLAQRGNSISEGDVLVLCIRLVSELFLSRYTLPEPEDPGCLIARHELGVWEETGKVVQAILSQGEGHRDDGFNTFVLPHCRSLIRATGKRMAYEAAKNTSSIRPEMLRLFETSCIVEDASWYVENTDLRREMIFEQYGNAVRAALPLLSELLEETRAAPWVTAPFLSAEDWAAFVAGLELFGSPGERGDEGGQPLQVQQQTEQGPEQDPEPPVVIVVAT